MANELLDSVQITHELIEVERNKVKSIEEILVQAQDKNKDLLETIASLEARPPEIRYIVETETVLVPEDPIFVTPDLPEQYLFQLADGLTVAEFAQLPEDEFKFETYELTFHGDIAISEERTATLFQVESSYEPGVLHELPVNLDVTRAEEDALKFFEPHIMLGATVGITTEAIPLPDVSASLGTTLIHPSTTVDLLGLRVSANDSTLKIGIDPVGVNVGKSLPLLNDLWILPGFSVDHTLQPHVGATIGTKL